jgi:hypothetical protein
VEEHIEKDLSPPTPLQLGTETKQGFSAMANISLILFPCSA